MSTNDRPNVLVILTDQQSASMMSCAGNRYLKTPAMDSLAEAGVRFERAYCTNPLCVPSRFSLMTGLMPSAIGLRSNATGSIPPIPEEIKRNGLGRLFRNAGYDTVYGGKQHLPKMTAEDIGFDILTHDERDGLAETCAEYIEHHTGRPFLLVASFVNPHDICHMAIRDFPFDDTCKSLIKHRAPLEALDQALSLPIGMSRDEFFAHHCPPLPPNFEIPPHEAEAISLMQARRPFKQAARERYTKERWRMHRWAYCRLTELVDQQIGRVLAALRESDHADNTVVVFTSDHGDMDAAHRMEHKSAFYDECTRVPLIVTPPGATRGGFVDTTHLVSNGLDMLPTLCDWAGIDAPSGAPGRSLRALVEGTNVDSWRTVLPVESELGRMIVTEGYKYELHDEGRDREQLVDLAGDPGEMRNAALDKDEEAELLRHRRLYEETMNVEYAQDRGVA